MAYDLRRRKIVMRRADRIVARLTLTPIPAFSPVDSPLYIVLGSSEVGVAERLSDVHVCGVAKIVVERVEVVSDTSFMVGWEDR